MTRRVFLQAVLTAFAATASAAPRHERVLVVVAELLDPPHPVPAAGTVRVVSIARYRVVKRVKGKYEHEVILVGFDALTGLPEKAGEIHRLTLIDRFPRGAALLNPFTDEVMELGMFYCRHVERGR
jgi:hypothetical protein